MKDIRPIPEKVTRLRQRQRADGSWRIWWEPETAVRGLGFEPLELDAGRPTWSKRAAERLNADVDAARTRGENVARSGGRTMEDLIEAYRRSPQFTRLKEKTRLDYGRKMKVILRKWGAQPVSKFTKPVMAQWYDTLVENNGAYQAVGLLRVMSLLFSHAENRLGWRAEGSNPCARLKMQVPKGRDRWAGWPEFDALMAAADALGWPDMACAIALSAFQGARQTDVRLARVDGFHNTAEGLVWAFERSKRGNIGATYVHEEALPYVRAMLDAARPGQVHLLHDPVTGGRWSQDRISKQFAEVRARAARSLPTLKSLQFRDLRRTFGVWSRLGGASREDVGDVLGNSVAVDPQLAEVYMPRQLATTRRAVEAVQRPVDQKKKQA